MKQQNRITTLIATAACVLGISSTAFAQLELNQFRPSERAHDGFAVSTADDLGHLRFGVQLYADYADDPLVFEATTGTGTTAQAQVVHQQLVGHLQLSLGLIDRLIIFVGLPYHFIVDGDSSAVLSNLAGVDISNLAPDGSGLGDLWVGARARLYGESDDIFQLAVQATANIHTASAAGALQRYRGDTDNNLFLGGHPELVFTFNIADMLRISGNVGYWVRENITVNAAGGQQLLAIGDELTFGLGAIVSVLDGQLDLIAEGFGRTGLSSSTGSTGFAKREETPIEVGGGLKYHHSSGFSAGAGANVGVQRGYGAPDYRVFGMVGFTMPEDTEPKVPPVMDADGDGIADDVDQCPNDPEDVDTFEDENGCPDPDNDGDGVLDVNDGAPMDPEDPDGFQDEDGVPDPDNDGDGVLDTDDRCPNEAGEAANNGCPDPDRDGDGVPDRIDNCPDVVGTPENHGCAEKQLVEIKEDKLEILEKVYFRTSSHKIRARSFALLDNVAEVIKAHPEISMIRVEGHTDERGNLKYNMRLSQRRAESVVRYLTRKGVSKDRLTAEGFGPNRPIKPGATTKEDHAANRRVEFNIVADSDPATE